MRPVRSAGKDRTGLIVASILSLLGVPRDAIVADYMLSNNKAHLKTKISVVVFYVCCKHRCYRLQFGSENVGRIRRPHAPLPAGPAAMADGHAPQLHQLVSQPRRGRSERAPSAHDLALSPAAAQFGDFAQYATSPKGLGLDNATIDALRKRLLE
jgi:hypothetical protein